MTTSQIRLRIDTNWRQLLLGIVGLCLVGFTFWSVLDQRKDYYLTVFEQGWGSLGINRSVDDNPLSIRDLTFERGLGTHATSHILLSLRKNFKRFSGGCGIDDETRGFGSIECEIVINGIKRFSSGRITGKDDAKWFDINLDGVRDIHLIITNGKDGIYSDHADWVNLQFLP